MTEPYQQQHNQQQPYYLPDQPSQAQAQTQAQPMHQQPQQAIPQNSYSATPPIPPPSQSPEWSHSFWDCCSPMKTCFGGWCCPCFLYGKTQSRLLDPVLREYSYANGHCCIYYLLSMTCLSWVLLTFKRGDLRHRFGMPGSTGTDCAGAYFCPCCTIVQMEKEVESRSGSDTDTGGLAVGYRPPEGMVFGEK